MGAIKEVEPDVVSAKRATLATVSVSIQAIRIDGKQMTQSVFTQLKHESLLDKDGGFRGTAWGTVNHHGKHCPAGFGYRHVHIIWQKASELRRDDFVIRGSPVAEAFRDDCTAIARIGHLTAWLEGQECRFERKSNVVVCGGWQSAVTPGEEFAWIGNCRLPAKLEDYNKSAAKSEIEKILEEADVHDLVPDGAASERIHGIYVERFALAKKAEAGWSAALKSIESLPQLFIAA